MTTKIELNKMRNEAFEKLKTDRSKFNGDDIFKTVELIRDYRATNKIVNEEAFSGIVEQIKTDVRLYKKHDCLSMWLDSQDGLAKYEPELIKRIAIEIGGLKEVEI